MADGEPEVVEQFRGILACGTLGGRLIKDKTFFFSYEGLRLRLPQVAVREVPSVSLMFARTCRGWCRKRTSPV